MKQYTKYAKSIFWFRQDLRIYDNTWLFEAVHNSEKILPIFILDTEILGDFWGLRDQKFGFLREALDKLSENIKNLGGKEVKIFLGKPTEIIPDLVEKYSIECVFTNTSYSQRGIQRDEQVAEKIASLGCRFDAYKDFLLVEPQEIPMRKVFTPYYKLWQKIPFETQELEIQSFSPLSIDEWGNAKDFIPHEKHPSFTLDFWKNRLERHIRASYSLERNNLDLDGTSLLSPYIRFGIFSIRQIYNNAKDMDESFVSELAWREFWHHIYYHFPEVAHTEFLEKRRNIFWENDEKKFESWKNGTTGYPIVDAAMKQLNTINWMHGRARMIVASFLTKDLHIDWRWGEAYFREKLLDYDCAVNIWNWQWSASVWADPKPLRIFNPILQSEKFSQEAKYIKKYLPEVELENTESIHNPLKYPLSYQEPIIDHSEEQKKAREYYKNASELHQDS